MVAGPWRPAGRERVRPGAASQPRSLCDGECQRAEARIAPGQPSQDSGQPRGPAATAAGHAGLCRPWGEADGNMGGSWPGDRPSVRGQVSWNGPSCCGRSIFTWVWGLSQRSDPEPST